jgi:Fe-S-cluster containining protein
MTKARRQNPNDPERERLRGLLDELARVYRDVDAAYAGYRCPSSTECCRFGVTGREPYVTSIELEAVNRGIARRGGPLSAKRRALPLFRETHVDERVCPLLDQHGHCSIYEARPLGCRSFWCDRAETPIDAVHRDTLAAFVRRIQEIAARHERDGERGRPLTRAVPG